MKALVIGGTGLTGPFIVNGLLNRGYQVTIFHRGKHEIAEMPSNVHHIHADPHYVETIEAALKNQIFDLTVASYGRLRFAAEALAGKTKRFIGLGGALSYKGFTEPNAHLEIPISENFPLEHDENKNKIGYLIAMSEKKVFQFHPSATYFRLPLGYGPHQPVPLEWRVIRRILDKRPYIILPNNGQRIFSHGYAANFAHAVLLAVDNPQIASGQTYNCSDEQVFALYEWVTMIAKYMDYDLEVISLPDTVFTQEQVAFYSSTHLPRILDISKIKNDLGYKDVMSAEEALGKTIQYYLLNPPETNGALENNLRDPFNYKMEDELVHVYTQCMEKMKKIILGAQIKLLNYHPYPHPKAPNLKADHRGR